MSKERLEEIKDGIIKCEKYAEIGDWEASYSHIINLHDDGHIKWLIDQVERVQELEELLLQTKYDKALHEKRTEEWLKLKSENQRYREALEIAKNEMEVHFKLGGTIDNPAYGTICNALEESK